MQTIVNYYTKLTGDWSGTDIIVYMEVSLVSDDLKFRKTRRIEQIRIKDSFYRCGGNKKEKKIISENFFLWVSKNKDKFNEKNSSYYKLFEYIFGFKIK